MNTRTDAVGLQADVDEVIIGEGVALAVPPAGMLLRAAGALIDIAVIFIGAVFGGQLFFAILYAWMNETGNYLEEPWIYVMLILWAVLWLVVIPLMVETLSHGRSLGKLAVGIRIVRLDGGAINFRHSFVRTLVGLVEIYLSSGAIAIIVSLLSPRGQRVGDLLAGTYAQLERLPKPRPLAVGLPPGLEGWARIADVSQLPDRVARRIRDFFTQVDKLSPEVRSALAADLARQAKPYVHPVPDVSAEVFLAAITVVRRERERRALVSRANRIQRLEPALNRLPHNFPDRG